MKCPHCASDNTIKTGIKYSSGSIRQRWYCKGCLKYFYTELDITKPIDTAKTPIEKEAKRLLKGVGKDIGKKTKK